jgi:hypothetical protein
VVLDVVAALVHRVRALAEAEEALVSARLEPNAHRLDAGRRGGAEQDDAVARRLEPRLDAAPQRVGRGELDDEHVALEPLRDDARGVTPLAERPEAECPRRARTRGGVLGQQRAAGVREGDPPGIVGGVRPQRAG